MSTSRRRIPDFFAGSTPHGRPAGRIVHHGPRDQAWEYVQSPMDGRFVYNRPVGQSLPRKVPVMSRSEYFGHESSDKSLSPEYYAFKLGKEYYRKPHRERMFIGLRKLEAKSGVPMERLLKEAREGYAMARAMDAQKKRTGSTRHPFSTSGGRDAMTVLDVRGAHGGRRAGTNHKHGPSKSGRKCPKCGV